jgi:hypothetical protein
MRNRLLGVWLGAHFAPILRGCTGSTKDIEPTNRGSGISGTEMVSAPAKVAILGEDPVIGRSLEILLQAAGYRARFLRGHVGEVREEPLADFHVLLVGPELSTEHRKALVDKILSPAAPSRIPIIELLPASGEHFLHGHVVIWPCAIKDLKRAIEAVLLAPP